MMKAGAIVIITKDKHMKTIAEVIKEKLNKGDRVFCGLAGCMGEINKVDGCQIFLKRRKGQARNIGGGVFALGEFVNSSKIYLKGCRSIFNNIWDLVYREDTGDLIDATFD